jgi:ATP-binding cassette subfamily F protein 3
MALNEFEGTVMLVSHDRALLRAVCDEFWLVGRGKVSPFDGDLDDYQKYLLDEAKRLREVAKQETIAAAAPPAAPVHDTRKQDAQLRQQQSARSKPLKRELEQAEKRMAELNAEKAGLEARVATALPPAEIARAGKRMKELGDELHALEERWLALSADLESIG